MTLSWCPELSGIETFNISTICMIGCLPGNNFGCPGLTCGWDTGNLIVFLFIPALPWPNLGLIWDTPFVSGVITGLINWFSGLIFESIPLSIPCTSSKIMPLVLVCDLVWTKCFSCYLSPML